MRLGRLAPRAMPKPPRHGKGRSGSRGAATERSPRRQHVQTQWAKSDLDTTDRTETCGADSVFTHFCEDTAW
jgi:hypothetical protein